jgi:hypothetical protein
MTCIIHFYSCHTNINLYNILLIITCSKIDVKDISNSLDMIPSSLLSQSYQQNIGTVSHLPCQLSTLHLVTHPHIVPSQPSTCLVPFAHRFICCGIHCALLHIYSVLFEAGKMTGKFHEVVLLCLLLDNQF